LSQELVWLALFDERLFSSTERLTVAALEKEETAKPAKQAEIDLSSFPSSTREMFRELS